MNLADLRKVASANKVEALVGDALSSAGRRIDPSWQSLVDNNQRRVRELLRCAEEACAALSGRACASAVIEGGSTLLEAGVSPAGYGAGDLDILVPVDRWETAQKVMRELGYSSQDRRGRPTKRREYARPGAETVWLEVGCQPFDRMWVPLRYRDRCDAWLRRRQPSKANSGLDVLNPTDAITLAGFHASLHSYVRSPALRLQIDIDRAARVPGIEWGRVVAEAKDMGISRRVFCSFAIAKALFQSPIPESVLQRLFPGETWWKQVRSLLEGERVLTDGRPKLRGGKALWLDALLNERGAIAWSKDIVLPPGDWLKQHLGDGPTLLLHAKRFWLLASRWRREVE
ncbi:MAG: nucleotidyltransferase family protein [Polyangiaceae bacterium]